jgi:hypothetical protein
MNNPASEAVFIILGYQSDPLHACALERAGFGSSAWLAAGPSTCWNYDPSSAGARKAESRKTGRGISGA